MINPENKIPVDDSDDLDKEDQISQQDIHSNGYDENPEPPADPDDPKVDFLQQASDASEPSFTLHYDKGIAPRVGEDNKKK
jgi:hypothetical protein